MAEIKKQFGGLKGARAWSKFVALVLSILLIGSTAIIAGANSLKNPTTAVAESGISLSVSSQTGPYEVQKGDTITYVLRAEFNSEFGTKSGLVTFTDVLPKYTKLVGIPEIDQENSSQGYWQKSREKVGPGTQGSDTGADYTYNNDTRELKMYINNMNGAGDNNAGVIQIIVKAVVTDDAYSLQKEDSTIYYVNTATVKYSKACKVTNAVTHYSKGSNVPDETKNKFKIVYFYKGSEVPASMTPPIDNNDYEKGSTVSLADFPSYDGYTFSGWHLINTDTSKVRIDTTTNELIVDKTFGENTVCVEGTWSEVGKQDTKTWTMYTKWRGVDDGNYDIDSTIDKPKDYEDRETTGYPQGITSIGYPQDPTEYDKINYKFLGFKLFIKYEGQEAQDYTKETLGDEQYKQDGQVTLPTSSLAVQSITIVGYFERTSFTVSFKEGTNWPSSAQLPEDIQLKWGKEFTVPLYNNVDGGFFDGWVTEPTLEATDTSGDTATYTMPKSVPKGVTFTGNFDRAFTLSIKGGTATTTGQSEANTEFKLRQGTHINLKPNALTDLTHTGWTYDDESSSGNSTSMIKNWQEYSDGRAEFDMPANNITLVAHAGLEITFKVNNGFWATGNKYATYNLPMEITDSGTWRGTLTNNAVDEAVGGIYNAEPSASYDSETGHWEGRESDDDFRNDLPDNCTQDNFYTASVKGSVAADCPRFFNYLFESGKVTVRFGVKDCDRQDVWHTAHGTVAWVQNDGEEPSDGDWSDVAESNEIDALYDGDRFAAGIAFAKPDEGFHLSYWTKEERDWISYQDEDEEYNKEHPDAPNRFVPSPEISEDEDADGNWNYIWYGGTYLAVFEGNPYTIHYDGNGAKAGTTTPDQLMKYDAPAKLSENRFEKDGYVFAGWTTNPDGSGTKYAPGQSVTDLTTERDGTFTLYAQWRQASSGQDETDSDYKTYAYANDIHISLEKAKEFLEKSDEERVEAAAKWANAFAVVKDDASLETEEIGFGSIDARQFDQVAYAMGGAQIGEFETTLTTDNGEASVAFKMCVTDQCTDPSSDDELGEVTLVSNNFTVSGVEIESLSLDDEPDELNNNNRDGLKYLIGTSYGKDGKGVSFAKAWKTSDVNETYRLVVTENSIQPVRGTYFISFAAIDESGERIKGEDGADLIVTSTVTVLDRASTDKVTPEDPDPKTTVNDNYREVEVFANDFTIGINEVNEGGLASDGSSIDPDSPIYSRLVELANATVQYTTDYSKKVYIGNIYSWIQPQKGTYVVKYVSNVDDHGKRATVLVNCVVKDKSGYWVDETTNEEYRISANDVLVSTEQAKTYGLEEWVSASKAEATKTASVAGENDVDITSVARLAGFGVDEVKTTTYDKALTLSTSVEANKGAEVTIGAEVRDKVDSDNDDPALATVKQGANNVNVSTAEVTELGLDEPVATMSDDAKSYLLSHSQAKAIAWNTTTLHAIQPTVKDSTISEERGTYTVTFEAENIVDNVKHVANSTVKVRVNDNHKTSEAENVEISAKNISLFVDEVKSNKLTSAAGNAKLIELAEAQGFKMSDGTLLDADHLKVTSNNLKEERGKYTVEFTAINPEDEKETVSVEIVANVYNRGSVDENANERITANNFIVQKSEIAGLSTQDWVDIARAQAEVVESIQGKQDAIAVAQATRQGDFAADEVAIGSYDNAVKFATEAGTNVQVAAKVFEQVGKDATAWNDSSVSIGANSFTLSSDVVAKNGLDKQANQLSASAKEYLVKHAQSFAINVEDYTEVATTVSDCNISSDKGTYSVTFEATGANGNKVHATVDAKIVGNGAEAGNNPTGQGDADKTGQIFLSANNIFLTVKQVREGELAGNDKGEVSAAGEQNLIGEALASAYRLVDGSAVDVKVKSSGIKNARGSYVVTFTATNPNDASASVDVSVVAKVVDRSSSDVKNNEAITANNIYVSRDDVTKMTESQWMTMANAVAEKMVSVSGESDAVELVSAKRVNEFAGDDVAIGYYANAIEFATSKGTTITIGAQVFVETGTDVEFTPGDDSYNQTVEDFSRVNVYVGANTNAIPLAKVSELGLDKGSNLSQEATDYLIERMQASAMRTSDGMAIKPTATTTIQNARGTWTVTFTATDEAGHSASAVVIVRVISSSVESEGTSTTFKEDDETTHTNQIILSANDVRSYVDHVKAYDLAVDANGQTSETGTANLTKLAEAKAAKVWDGSKVDVELVSSNIKAKRGTFYATFSAANPDDPTEAVTLKIKISVALNGASSKTATNSPASFTLFGDDDPSLGADEENESEVLIAASPVFITKDNANKIKDLNNSEAADVWKTLALADAWKPNNEDPLVQDTVEIVSVNAVTGTEFAQDIVSADGLKVGKYEESLEFVAEDGTSTNVDVVISDAAGANVTVGEGGITWEDVDAMVGANNFWVPTATVKALGLNKTADELTDEAKSFLLKHAQVWGVDLGFGADTTDGTVEELQPVLKVTGCTISEDKGTYTVTYQATTVTDEENPVSATVTVNARVSDEGDDSTEQFPQESPLLIRANDIRVSIDEVKNLELAKSSEYSMSGTGFENLVKLADAEASRLSDGRRLNVSMAGNDIKAERGKYEVTFRVDNGSAAAAFVSVKAQVLEHSTQVDGNNERISANNLIVQKDKVATFTQQDWINIASATAQKVTSVVGEADKVDVTQATKVKDFNGTDVKVGTYDNAMTFKTDKGTSVTVGAQVFDATGSGDKSTDDAKVYVGANNFQIAQSVVESLGINKSADELTDDAKAYLVKHAQARAVDCYGFEEVTPDISVNNISEDKGTYTIEFKATSVNGDEATCTVQARVANEGEESSVEADAAKVVIHANNIYLSVDELKDKNLTSDTSYATLIEEAEVNAVKLADGTLIEAKVEGSKIVAERGVYDVVFSATNPDDQTKTATVTVKATVSDWGNENGQANEKLTANDMFVSKEEASSLDEQGWADASGAFAQKLDSVVGEADEAKIAKATKSGAFAEDPEALGYYYDALTLGTDKGTDVTLDVQVLDQVAYDTDKANVKVAANEAVLSKAWVEDEGLDFAPASMSEDAIAVLKDLTHVRAIDLTDFTVVEPELDASTLRAVKGGYVLTFVATSKDGQHTATLEIPVRVSDNGEQSSNAGVDAEPNGKILLNTNDITVSKSEVAEHNLVADASGETSEDAQNWLIETTLAKGTNLDFGEDVQVSVKSNEIVEDNGNYKVVFTSTNPADETDIVETETNVKVVDFAVVDYDKGVRIYGHKARMGVSEADKILMGQIDTSAWLVRVAHAASGLNEGEKELVRLAGVVAESTEDGTELDITSIDKGVKAELGDYATTFSVGGVSLTVPNVNVASNATEDANIQTRMTANDVNLTYEEAGELLSKSNDEIATELASKANAYAFNTDTGKDVSLESAEWNVEAKEGTYTATFHTDNDATITTQVSVGQQATSPIKTGDATILTVLAFIVLAAVSYTIMKLSKRRHERNAGAEENFDRKLKGQF